MKPYSLKRKVYYEWSGVSNFHNQIDQIAKVRQTIVRRSWLLVAFEIFISF